MNLRQLNTVADEYRDFDDTYFVGDDGHIYRRLKSGYCRSRKHPYQQVRNTFGTDKQVTVRIPKAVALAFCVKPTGATDVDHINNDKTDNRASNLRWVTHRENLIKKSADRRKQNNG